MVDRSFVSSIPGGSDPPEPPDREEDGGEDVDVDERPRAATPRKYKVIFHNDDFTTMEFVVDVLARFFRKTEGEATHIMLTVHRKGNAVAGVYPRDVAETKVQQVMEYARQHGMPLLVTTEPE